jgi:hypothetical protein
MRPPDADRFHDLLEDLYLAHYVRTRRPGTEAREALRRAHRVQRNRWWRVIVGPGQGQKVDHKPPGRTWRRFRELARRIPELDRPFVWSAAIDLAPRSRPDPLMSPDALLERLKARASELRRSATRWLPLREDLVAPEPEAAPAEAESRWRARLTSAGPTQRRLLERWLESPDAPLAEIARDLGIPYHTAYRAIERLKRRSG